MLVSLLAGAAPWSNAQIATTTATLSGVVADPSGALVPAATVTLTSSEKGITRQFITAADGRYSFIQLPPSTYVLSVSAKGFETYKQAGIALNPADTDTQNVALVVGSENQSITVTADASQLNTDNSNVATNLSASTIEELPLNTRNVYGLASLNSAVSNTSEGQMLLGGGTNTTDDADQDISFMNFAGGFFGTTGFMLDGSWDTDTEWGGVIFVPSVDAVQEFKVQNNSFTAQYGWSTGNVVNVVTKSGTNTFHGDAWDFYQNQDLNAVPYFSNSNQSLSRQEIGVAAGGPLYIPRLYQQREKTFIFGLYEHLTISTPTVDTYTVPDIELPERQLLRAAGNLFVGQVTLWGGPSMWARSMIRAAATPSTAGQTDTKTASNPYGTGLMATSERLHPQSDSRATFSATWRATFPTLSAQSC